MSTEVDGTRKATGGAVRRSRRQRACTHCQTSAAEPPHRTHPAAMLAASPAQMPTESTATRNRFRRDATRLRAGESRPCEAETACIQWRREVSQLRHPASPSRGTPQGRHLSPTARGKRRVGRSAARAAGESTVRAKNTSTSVPGRGDEVEYPSPSMKVRHKTLRSIRLQTMLGAANLRKSIQLSISLDMPETLPAASARLRTLPELLRWRPPMLLRRDAPVFLHPR